MDVLVSGMALIRLVILGQIRLGFTFRSHLLGSMGDAALPPQLVLRRMALVDDLETAFSAVKNEKVEEVLDLKQELSNIDDRLWLRHAMANRILTCAASLQRLQAPWIAKHFTALCCEQLALCRRKNLHLVSYILLYHFHFCIIVTLDWASSRRKLEEGGSLAVRKPAGYCGAFYRKDRVGRSRTVVGSGRNLTGVQSVEVASGETE